jgi:hypothetical protein
MANNDNDIFNYVASADRTAVKQNIPKVLSEQELKDKYWGKPPEMHDLAAVNEQTQKHMEMIGDFAIGATSAGPKVANLAKNALKTPKLRDRVVDILEKVQRPKFLKNWLTDTKPSKSTVEDVQYGIGEAWKNITSPSGFKRFINTVKRDSNVGPDPPFKIPEEGTKEYTALYKTFQAITENKLKSMKVNKMSRIQTLRDPKVQGLHWGGDYNKIQLNEHSLRMKNKDYSKSVGVHESTHGAQLPVYKNPKDIGILSEQKGADLSTTVGQRGKYWLEKTLWDSRQGLWDKNDWWEVAYGKKISPYLKGYAKTRGVTKPFVIRAPRYKDHLEYLLQPHEISARMSQIRSLRNISNPTKSERKLLRDLELNEERLFSKEGVDYAVNKLWGAAPVGIGLNEIKDK